MMIDNNFAAEHKQYLAKVKTKRIKILFWQLFIVFFVFCSVGNIGSDRYFRYLSF